MTVAAPMRPGADVLRTLTETNAFTLGRPTHIRVLPDGGTVLYLRSGPRDRIASLWELEVASGRERLLVSPDQLLGGREETLSKEEKAARERKRISTGGFTGFELAANGDRVVLKLSGRVWVLDRKSGRCNEVPIPGGVVLDPRLSPAGDRVAFVRDHDLYVTTPATSTLVALTSGGSETLSRGLAEFVAQEEMSRFVGYWWAPDGTMIAYQETDTSALERFTIADASRPEHAAHTFAYPRAGKANADVRLFVVTVDARRRVEITWDRARYPYLARVSWQRGAPLSLLVQSRDQRSALFLRADVESGQTSVMVSEDDAAWLNLSTSTPRWLADGKSFLFATERAGAWAIERRWLDGRVAPVIGKDAGFHQLTHVDEGRGIVWFLGGDNPVETHLFRAPLDGSAPPVRVTPEGGEHDATFAQNGAVFVVTRTTLSRGARSTIHGVSEQPIVIEGARELPSRAIEPDVVPNVELVPPERAGGFNAAIIRPRNFEPGRRYPVVLHVYGGPGFAMVHSALTGYFMPQWVADHGFVVVSLDGRGTPRRGRAFERALAGKFGSVPLDDQVAGLAALGKLYPELDLARTGVYGWSFGGYMAALAVLKRPDVFKVGVAGAPVVDWLYYDTHYTERYLGLPAEAPAAYEDASLLAHAPRLERPLLLVHGIADDNVYFAHTLQLADALFRARRPFELLPLVGLTHQVADPAVREALYERIVTFLGAALW